MIRRNEGLSHANAKGEAASPPRGRSRRRCDSQSALGEWDGKRYNRRKTPRDDPAPRSEKPQALARVVRNGLVSGGRARKFRSGGRDWRAILHDGGQDPQKGDSVACYCDAGRRFAASLGAEPVRSFSPGSAPFALARGKITGIITSSSGLITQIKKSGRLVPQNLAAEPKSKLRWRTLAQGRPRQP